MTDSPDSRTPLVLLHGLGANRQAFQRFARLLPAHFEVHPLDLLGHGDAPKPERGYSLADYATHLLEDLERLGLRAGDAARRPIIAGHSLGAAVAVRAAALTHEAADKLVLLDPPAGTGRDTQRMLDAKLEGRLHETIEDLFPHFGEPLRRWTLGTWEQMAPGVARELNSHWHDWAAHVPTPVTVIHGDRSEGASGEGAHEHFPAARAIRIPGAGHFLHATHAREVAQSLVDAIHQHRGAPDDA